MKNLLSKISVSVVVVLLMVLAPLVLGQLSSGQAQAQEAVSQESQEKKIITIYTRPDCSHCVDLKKFLDDLATERDDFVVEEVVMIEPDQVDHWNQVVDHFNLAQATPVMIMGTEVMQGFNTGETTGRMMTDLLDAGYENISVDELLTMDPTEITQAGGTCDEECVVPGAAPKPFYLKIPFLGVKDVTQYSLPVLATILGFVDGFNPCAMWVLITFLVILMQLKDKKKMYVFVGTFLVAEALMYFMILSFWFTAWDFVGLDAIVTPIVGLVAVGAGVFFLREAWLDHNECVVGDAEQKIRTKNRIEALVSKNISLLSILGILGVAFSVNIVEFACSIGIPQTFTKILELNDLNFFTSLPYTLWYTVMYMVDDFIVFGIAIFGAGRMIQTQVYTRYSHIIGGVLMLILGLIMLLKPDLLAGL